MRFSDAVNVDDMRRIAKKRLPRMVFDALDGGADDEVSLRDNRDAYQRVQLRPRPFADVSSRDLSTTVFGDRISMPVMLSPTGSGRLAAPDAELSLARVVGRVGTIYAHSTVASFSPEDVARSSSGPLWFQLYLPPDRKEAREFIQRVQAAGYASLLLTVDTPVRGNRERDSRNKFSLPYKVTPSLIAQGLSRPAWSARFVASNLRSRSRKSTYEKPRAASLRQVESQLIAARWPATWDDVEFVREVWDGPLLAKGIMRADEVPHMLDRGFDGVVVSNHGGRQLDGVPATIDVLPSIVEAVDGRGEVYLDGGVRRGTDVLKAIALGARACFVGRPYIYALAAGGEAGLERMLEIFREEIDRTLALLGCSSISEVDASMVERLPRCRCSCDANS